MSDDGRLDGVKREDRRIGIGSVGEIRRKVAGGTMVRGTIAFVFGLLLMVNAALPGTGNLRTHDVASIICFVLFGWNVVSGRRVDRAALVLGVVLLVSLEWVGAEIWVSGLAFIEPNVQVVLGRWLLGGFAAYFLYLLSGDRAIRTHVYLGMCAGAVIGLATVAFDFQTFDLAVTMPTLGMEDIVFTGPDDTYRASGMYSHPNEAAGVVLIGAAILIGLIEEKRLPKAAILLVVALAFGTFWLTKSRSQASIVTVLVILWSMRNARQYLAIGMVLAVLALAASSAGLLPGFGDEVAGGRLDDDYLGENFAGRLETTLQSMEIALQNPFGVGSSYVFKLYRETGYTSTHNAFMQLAMMGGVPLLLLMVTGLIGSAWTLWRRSPWRVEGWLALYFICVFNVENYFFFATMSTLAQLLVVIAWRGRPAVEPEPEPVLEQRPDRRLRLAAPRGRLGLPPGRGPRKAVGRPVA